MEVRPRIERCPVPVRLKGTGAVLVILLSVLGVFGLDAVAVGIAGIIGGVVVFFSVAMTSLVRARFSVPRI